MVHLESDYNNGAHEAVLRRLVETNDEPSESYGDDKYSQHARELIREVCQASQAQVWFLAGGTQTNAAIIDSVIKPYEGVLCADTAHINVHEAGAVEATGHKVIALPSHEGKIDVQRLADWLSAFFADGTADHMVRPGLLYVTYPTELGTLYSFVEMSALKEICQKYGLRLYIDGARLAYGLAAEGGMTLPQLAQMADVFYIGGTKCGALCGEAVVFPKGDAPDHMLSRIKRHGALLAKSRVVGVQFEALFSDYGGQPLYLGIGCHAVKLAMRVKKLLIEQRGYLPFINSETNQQFMVVPNGEVEELRHHVGFEVWCPADGQNTVCRFVTSWATKESDIEELEREL